ncbi:MAG TPA: DUF72 domain-containing protein [Firmicutes bacterium]|jgi:uncharacterized protein YecE (DUF72 family)|nr:DUF72 domain-containing protein [Bacillota bacterium]
MILIGTSGFSYKDWVGVLYPENTKSADMLEFYARIFPSVELNFTYYQMPSRRTIEGLVRKVPDDFEFCVKANKAMTHEIDGNEEPGIQRATFDAFMDALKPMTDRGVLGCILAQFPWSFKKTQSNTEYVLQFKDLLSDVAVVVEFRNAGWISDETFDLLRSYDLAFCAVDEPRLPGLVPPIAEATSDLGYIRFHGRNAKKWWKHSHPGERYDYLYSEAELNEWIPKIQNVADKTKKTYVFFNNCHSGQAADNARMLQAMLGLEL